MKEWVKYVILGIAALIGLPLSIMMWAKVSPLPGETAAPESASPPGLVEMEFFDRPTPGGRTRPGVCALPGLDLSELPEDAEVYVGGAYGGQELGRPIDRTSGHEGHLMKVTVNSPERPVLLMLGTYEPTVWRIEWTEGTRILGALVTGYHSQFVSGLPADTPVLISSYDQKGPCGRFYPDPRSRRSPDDFADLSRTLFGRKPTAVILAEKGRVSIGPEPGDGRSPVSAAPWRPEEFELTGPWPGVFGLKQAVEAGLIRPALVRDRYRWQLAKYEREKAAALAEGLPERLIPPLPKPQGSGDQPLHLAYVVLSPDFILPDYRSEGHAAFFLPPGIPLPHGDRTYRSFKFMEDGRILGGDPKEW